MKKLSWPGLFKNAFRRFWRQRGTESVAILAYTSLIGIVPMLAVMLSLFSISSWFDSFEQLVMTQVVSYLMPDSQPIIQHYVSRFAQQASDLALPGIVVMLLTTLMLLWTIDQKINTMWPQNLSRRWWNSLLHYLGISLLGPILLGLSLAMSSYVFANSFLDSVSQWTLMDTRVLKLFPMLVSLIGFVLLFKWVPLIKIQWHQAWWVGLMAAVEFEVLKFGFGWYLKAFPTYDLVYGALAAVPIFLLWLYLMWLIVMWNASVLAEMTAKNPQ